MGVGIIRQRINYNVITSTAVARLDDIPGGHNLEKIIFGYYISICSM